MAIKSLAQMQNFFSSQSFQTFNRVAGMVSDIGLDLMTKLDEGTSENVAESFWRELPPDNPLFELAEQNAQLILELAEASAALKTMATLAIQIHALFTASPRDPKQRTDISSLPNELLARIFEEATYRPSGFNPVNITAVSITLSHVCRHWRLAALNLPNLWAEVELEQCQEERAACLERSKNAPLRVTIENRWNSSRSADMILDIGEFLDAVIPHTGRWCQLEMVILSLEARRDFFSIIEAQHSTLDVPILTDLYVDYIYDNMVEMVEELGEEVIFFYRKWNMPNLRSLDVDGCLSPHRMLDSITFGTNLTRCSLALRANGIRNEMALSFSCWDFLLNHPCLEEFRLSIFCEVEELDFSFTPLTLPSLKTLIIRVFGSEITDSDESLETMSHFMDSLDMPYLSKLVLSLDGC